MRYAVILLLLSACASVPEYPSPYCTRQRRPEPANATG